MSNEQEIVEDQVTDVVEGDDVDDAEAAFLEAVEAEESPAVIGAQQDKTDDESESEEVAAESIEDEAKNAGSEEEDRFTKLEKRLRKSESKYGELNSRFLDLNRQATEQVSKSDAPSKDQISAAMEDGEKFKELSQDFPEWAGALKETIDFTTNSIMGKMPDVSSIKSEIRNEMETMRGMMQLDTQHRGWEDTVKSKDFLDFAHVNGPSAEERQTYYRLNYSGDARAADMYSEFLVDYPDWEYGELLISDNPNDAIKMIDQYKASREGKPSKTSSKGRLARSVAATNSTSRAQTAKVSSAEDAFLSGFEG